MKQDRAGEGPEMAPLDAGDRATVGARINVGCEAENGVLVAPDRLRARACLAWLEQSRSASLDRLTRLAARILRAPVALVSLVDDHRQFFASEVGLREPWATCRETPLSHSFCKHVVCTGEALEVTDARVHPRVAGNPAIHELGVVAYLGVPIRGSGGQVVGSFCVIDSAPHEWSAEDRSVLGDLAECVMTEFELHERSASLNDTVHRHRAWMSQLPVAALECDRQGAVLGWNVEAERLFGLVNAVVRGRSAEALLDLPAGILAAPGVRHRELVVRSLDGGVRPVACTVSVVPEGEAGVGGYVLMFEDLRELREAVLREAEVEAQLRQAQRLEALGTFAGGLAHEMNNLLAVIFGNLQLAQDPRLKSDESSEALAEAVNALGRVRALVQRMLTFSRSRPMELTEICLGRLVMESAEMVRRMLPEGVRLVVHEEASLPWVRADRLLLEQVLLNLLGNGAYALGGREGALEVRTRRQEVGGDRAALLGVVPGTYVALEVKDEGCGMSEDVRRRIFDPFFTTKPPGQGTGLGLSVVLGIVRDHRGGIEVTSEPGVGSEFRILLPAVQKSGSTARTEGQSATRAEGRLEGASILLVDDEVSVVTTFTRLLQSRDYSVAPFTSAQRALDAFHRDPEHYDLVITDCRMPEVDGLMLARRIHETHPGHPLIMLTGAATEELRLRAERCGVTEVIQKGGDVEGLCAAVRRVLVPNHTQSSSAREKCRT